LKCPLIITITVTVEKAAGIQKEFAVNDSKISMMSSIMLS
jgi:hypothetical protein